jgi:hypothetical protein
MPWDSGKSKLYENYLGNTQNMLGQYSIGTGRTANPDQMYNMTQGITSPLLDWDLKRRQQRLQNYMIWKKGHDERKGQGTAIEGIVKAVLESIGSMNPSGGGGGGGSTGLTGGGSGVAGVGSSGSFGDWTGGMAFGDGGVIEEPIVGQGVLSGQPYMFGEKGKQEMVVPTDQSQQISSGQPVQTQAAVPSNFWDLMKSKEEQVASQPVPKPMNNTSPEEESMNQLYQREMARPTEKRMSQAYRTAYSGNKLIEGVVKTIAGAYSGNYSMMGKGIQGMAKGGRGLMDDSQQEVDANGNPLYLSSGGA